MTVLMPVYNAERFLAAAIESILNQSFRDFEFLIIDDCSTDRSVEVIRAFPDPRIRLYRNDRNLGISATLNRGIALAESAYIARMDSDDVSHPDRLQKQYGFIQANPDGALYSCWVRVVDENRQLVRQDVFESAYYYYNLNFICWIYHPTVIYRKDAVQDVGGYTTPYAEDFELFWQLTRKYKHYHQPEVLLDYRVTGQSLHQVVRKQEYEQAQQEQLLRNVRYYAGADYSIPASYLECYRHNFKPLLEQQDVQEIVQCIRELDYLSASIVAKENVNRDPEAIRAAAAYKRQFIIDFFARNLPRRKGTLLLLKLGQLPLLVKIASSHTLRKLGLPC